MRSHELSIFRPHLVCEKGPLKSLRIASFQGSVAWIQALLFGDQDFYDLGVITEKISKFRRQERFQEGAIVTQPPKPAANPAADDAYRELIERTGEVAVLASCSASIVADSSPCWPVCTMRKEPIRALATYSRRSRIPIWFRIQTPRKRSMFANCAGPTID